MKSLLIKTIRILVVAGVLSAALIYYVYHQMDIETLPPVEQPRHLISSEHKNETEWMLHDIVSNIVEMICYSRFDTGFSADDIAISILEAEKNSYDISIVLPSQESGFEVRIEIVPGNNHIWSPSVYTEVAQQVLAVLDLAVPAPQKENDLNILHILQDVSLEILENENIRISKILVENMLDVHAHEEAAVLLGMLALREYAGIYTDVRTFLNSITAHLAVARALDPDIQDKTLYRYADVVTSILVHHQQEALEKLNRMNADLKGNRVHKVWHDALKTRITSDWRILKDEELLTPFEGIELFRAMSIALSSNLAIEWYKTNQTIKIPFAEAARIASYHGCSVSNGHTLTKNGVSNEFYEMSKVITHFDLGKYEELVKYLNRIDTRCVKTTADGSSPVKVIRDGLWAGYFQRTLICRASLEYGFYLRRWAVKERAKKFRADVLKTFKGLYLLPIFERRYAENQGVENAAVEKMIAWSCEHPELFNVSDWSWIKASSANRVYPDVYKNFTQWFEHWIPLGTAYNLYDRYHWGSGVIKEKTQFFKNHYTQSPYDYNLIQEGLEILEHENKFSSDQVHQFYGSLTDYHLSTMLDVADRFKNHNSQKYVETLSRICEFNPDYYFTLGGYFADQNLDDQAAQAYQKGMDRSLNRVWAANSCDWLVNYYYDKGEELRAYTIAQEAAEAYSHNGLLTMAKLLEKMKRFEEAEDYFSRMDKRYDSPGDLLRFYQDHADINGYDKKYTERMKKIFPKGTKSVEVSDYSGRPEKGVLIESSSTALRKHNLSRGDVIVAIEGTHVENLSQFYAVRDQSDDPNVEFIVWSDNRYKHVKAHLEGRRFGVSIGDYTR